MTPDDRRKKLAHAEIQWASTRRRIKRLQTAEQRWYRRVQYHTDKMQLELAADRRAFEAETLPTGRKFRG